MATKSLEEYRPFMAKAELHKSVNALIGMLEGVSIDRQITADEIVEVRNWYELHQHLMDCHPFSEILPVLGAALSDGTLDTDEISDLLWLCNNVVNAKEFPEYFGLVTCGIQQLEGILHGIMADNVITDKEILQLREWMDDHDFLCGTYPFDEIYSLLVAAREDGIISEDERNMLKAFFSTFIDTRESYNISEIDVKALQEKYTIGGICATDPDISFKDKIFCFTGESKKAHRAEIAQMIEQAGGIFNNNVVKKTDYLIVGADGNPCWAFACYGRKVEKAIELRKAGAHIVVVNELDFWDALG